MSEFVLHKNDANRATVFANLIAFLNRLPLDRAWHIDIVRWVKKKSNPQNKALWGLAYKILKSETGEDVNYWHEYMLGEHFGWREIRLFGKRKIVPARTTTTDYDGKELPLSTIEFADYFEFIQHRAANNGISIPDPDTFWREHVEQARAAA